MSGIAMKHNEKKQINLVVRITHGLKADLQKKADAEKVSLSTYVRGILCKK